MIPCHLEQYVNGGGVYMPYIKYHPKVTSFSCINCATNIKDTHCEF